MIQRVALPFLIVCCVLPASSWASDAFESPVAIINVTAHTGGDTVIEGATILMDGGRITGVGASLTVPQDARVVDGAGLHAYPGFIDAASHLGIKDKKPSKEVLARVTDEEYPVRQGPRTHMQQANRLGVWPHLGVADFYNQDDDATEAYRKAGFTTALVTPYPDIMSGSGDVLQLGGKPLRSATVASGLTQMVGFGDLNSVDYGQGREYPASPMGVVAVMRQLYMDAAWYRERHALYDRNPTKLERPVIDPVLEAMKPLVDREQTWIFNVDSPNEIHHALDLAKEFNQRIVIVGGKEAYKVADRLVAEKVPVIYTLDFEEKPKLEFEAPKKKTEYTTVSWTPDFENDHFEPLSVRRDRVAQWEEHVNAMHTLMTAGVTVAVSSMGEKPGDLIKHLNTALELDLTPEEALVALSSAPAKILGLESQIGSLSSGALGNVTLLTAPLGEKDSQVRHVFVDGDQFTYTIEAKKSDDADEGDSDSAEDEDGDDADEDKADDESDKEPEDKHPWSAEFATDRVKPITTNGDVLLQNASVIPVTDPIQHNTDILVRDGKIRAIGQNLSAPDRVTRIDVTGYWVMPGIIDPHSHIAVTGINEWTQSISSEVRQADVVDHTAQAIYNALGGGVTTIHTMHGSANSMGGQNAVLKLKYNTSPSEMLVTSGPRIVKFALGENVTRSRPIPRFPNSRMGVESVHRHAFNEALKYQAEWAEYERRSRRGDVVDIPRKDLRLEAISDIMAGKIWVHSHCYRGDEMLRLLQVAEDYGFRIATLQHVLEGYRVAYEMANHGVGGSTFADWWSYKKEAFDAIPYNAKLMMDAGVVTSLNSDDSDLIRHLNLDAGKMLRFGGMTAEEALKLITINPAIQIGLDDRVGSIEVGKDGDLAVFSMHPLDSHSKNVMTLVEGEVFFLHPDMKLDGSTPGPATTAIPEPPRGLLPVPQPAETYAIVGATIHPITGPAVAGGTLILREGKIVDVLASDSRPAGATIVDTTGLHVYPGLINASTQVGLEEISAFEQTRDQADLATFQPELRAMSAINPHSEHIPVTMCEGITLVHSAPSGGIISGRSSAVQLTGWTMPEMLRKDHVGLVMDLPVLRSKASYDEEKDYTEALEGQQERYEELEAFMRDAAKYDELRDIGADIPINLRMEAMRPYVSGSDRVFFRAESLKEILQALNFAEAFNLRPVIVGGGQAWKIADTLAEKEIPVIVTSVFTNPFAAYGGAPDSYERFDSYYENAATLHEAGVLIAIASDGAEFARQLNTRAGFSVAHGLPASAGVEAITINAAKVLGLDDEVGSLEPGKIADVIITTGDPTQASTRTVGMFIAGQPVELTSLHERSYEKFDNRPKPDLEPTGELRGPPPMRTK